MMNPRSTPPALLMSPTSHPASAGSPKGLMKKATAKNATPPVGSPVANRITAPMNTKDDATPKKIADTDSRKLQTAVTIVKVSANGMAITFKMNFNIDFDLLQMMIFTGFLLNPSPC